MSTARQIMTAIETETVGNQQREVEQRLQRVERVAALNAAALGFSPAAPAGRLTLTSGEPRPSTVVTGASTIYFTPFNGSFIPLYIGGVWTVRAFQETALSIASLTAATVYNIYGYWDGEKLALEASATGTAEMLGRVVKSGDPDHLYLGTIYTSGAGTTEHSAAKKFVWNYFNQFPLRLVKSDSTGHTYGTAAYRYWNNDSSNKVEFVTGLTGWFVDFSINMDTTAGASATAFVGAGLDTASSPHPIVGISNGVRSRTAQTANEMLSAGYHYISSVEYATANSTFSSMRIDAQIMG